jgi:hypothetical protein
MFEIGIAAVHTIRVKKGAETSPAARRFYFTELAVALVHNVLMQLRSRATVEIHHTALSSLFSASFPRVPHVSPRP